MPTLHVIGLMSGSSLDGVDLAHCRFTFADEQPDQLLSWALLRAATIPYTDAWQQRLRMAPTLGGRELWLLHTELGMLYGQVVRDFMATLDAPVDMVASHGHTVFHFPEQATTTQVGDGAAMAGGLGLPVIDQFRTLDMALGGQGAPLAPLGDQYFYGDYFAALNLGGIANVSIRTPQGYIALDIGGANQVLDALMAEIGESYDADGALAATGSLVPELLAQADALPFFALPSPKSLGNDWVQEALLPLFRRPEYSLSDRLHTFCHHLAGQTAASIHRAIAQAGLTLSGDERMIIAGGGGFNGFLCRCIAEAVAPIQIDIADRDMIAFKEAAFIALAGALRWLHQPNVLPSATGARRAAVGGAVHWGGEGVNKSVWV